MTTLIAITPIILWACAVVGALVATGFGLKNRRIAASALSMLGLVVVMLFFPVALSGIATSYDAAPHLLSPYTGGTPYKVQLHSHSDWPGDGVNPGRGTYTPQEVADFYVSFGYDALAITDENCGAGQVPTGITYIWGVEVDDHDKGLWAPHIIGLNMNTAHGYLTWNNKSLQYVYDLLKAEGDLVVAAHPVGWGSPNGFWTLDQIMTYRPRLFEVVNADAAPRIYSEALWDQALTADCNAGTYPPMWGTATDCLSTNPAATDPFTMVYASAKTSAAIVASLRAGNCYASEGPTVTVTVRSLTATVTTAAAANITWVTKGGMTAQVNANTTSASYAANISDGYVRAVVTRLSDSKKAWTQPLFVKGA